MGRKWISAMVCLNLAAWSAAGAQSGAPRGTLVVVNGKDGTVSLVDLGSRAITATIPVGDVPREVALSPDGRWAVVTNYGGARTAGATLSVIDVSSGTLERTVQLGVHRRPHGIAWLANGTVLVLSETDSALVTLDASTWMVTGSMPSGPGAPYLLAVDRDGARAFVTNVTASMVTAVDVAGRRVLASASVPKSSDGVAVRPGSDEVWVTSPQSDMITVLGAADLKTRGLIRSGEYPVRVRFTPDGAQALAVFAKSSEVRLFDAGSRKEAGSIAMKVPAAALHGGKEAEGYESHTVPLGLELSPDGGWAFVTLGGVDAVAVVSLRTREIASLIFVGREPDGVAYSPLVRSPSE